VSESTNCNILPTVHPEQIRKVNVTACKPEWFLSATSGKNLHPPAGPITIVLPISMSGLSGPLTAAKADWSAALGRTINIVDETVGCPAGAGGACAVVDPTYSGAGCAGFQGGASDPATGEYTSPSSIRLWSDWASATASRNRRRMAHELGHFFGLRNQDVGCTEDSSLMATSPVIDGCNDGSSPPITAALGPTPGDMAKLGVSPYGNFNRKLCGW